ncbi:MULTISPECIES: hypothetical protein [Amycolatopsis]|uniref:Uncharacterized protein n=1 Tax=Amycolatopsis echigonensis TaxID=2576905 RepID=A0A8E1VYG3_9PSEU|nr:MULTISPECIES: hypothetical protein [Amycolatopsis]MBB2500738.1 hypothetical protein [Amycolatopsis echigonensis]MCG3751304.1 hypothetical protein [Amycolatopsis sp. Poz14]
MATGEEIERRVEEVDSARSARRSAAAKQVGDLAERRSEIAGQLAAIETQLGKTLAAANDVISIDELAQFTDVSATDLARWFDGQKPLRVKSQRSKASAAAAKAGPNHRPESTKRTAVHKSSAASEVGATSATTTEARAPVPPTVT